MLDAVQRNHLTDNTLIIFTSDNGPFPEGGTGGLRGGKGTAWDGGYRVNRPECALANDTSRDEGKSLNAMEGRIIVEPAAKVLLRSVYR